MLSQGTLARAEVWIQTKDGERLPEHEVVNLAAKEGEPAFSRCFAECKEETEFEIHVMIIKTHQKDDWWHAQCWVDGKRLDAKVALESDDDCVMTFKKLHEKLDGILVARNLTFGVVPTVVEKDDANIQPQVLRNLGTIEVTLERGTTSPGKASLPRAVASSDITVWEKDAKAKVASYAKGGTISAVKAIPRYHFKAIGPVYYKFQFNYRTREKLQIMRVLDADEDESRLPLQPVASAARPQPKIAQKRKRETEDIIHLLSDDDAAGPSAASGSGYITSKRNKFLEDENARLRRQLKARVIEPQDIVEVLDSDEE